MTTIVGIKSGIHKPSVVLASDLAMTETQWKSAGDVAYMQQTRADVQKIFVSEDNDFAAAISGTVDQPYVDFYTNLLRGKFNLREAIKSGYFSDFADLNLNRWNGKNPDQRVNSLLLASRFDSKPELYTVYPLGKVEYRPWTAIGSGSEFALDTIRHCDKFIPGYLPIKEAIDLASRSLENASRDIHTGGLDLVVIQPDRIVSFGTQISQALKFAREKVVGEIKDSFK